MGALFWSNFTCEQTPADLNNTSRRISRSRMAWLRKGALRTFLSKTDAPLFCRSRPPSNPFMPNPQGRKVFRGRETLPKYLSNKLAVLGWSLYICCRRNDRDTSRCLNPPQPSSASDQVFKKQLSPAARCAYKILAPSLPPPESAPCDIVQRSLNWCLLVGCCRLAARC
jgi:hypothetical protein